MSTLECPVCGEPTARLLDGPSSIATVNYYRCDQCGHVWNVPKNNPDAPATSVTRNDPPKD